MLTILLDADQTSDRETPGRVLEIDYYGDMSYYSVAVEGVTDPLSVSMRNTAGRKALNKDDKIRIGWSSESLILLD